jgi:hypothetical protein
VRYLWALVVGFFHVVFNDSHVVVTIARLKQLPSGQFEEGDNKYMHCKTCGKVFWRSK